MAKAATATKAAPRTAKPNRGARWWLPRVGIVVAAVGLIVAGAYAVLAPEVASANTAGQASWPCSVAADQVATLATNPPHTLTAATGTCVLALGQAETQLAALRPAVVTYKVHYEVGHVDPSQTQVTTWDGTRGTVKAAGAPTLFIARTGGTFLTGEQYTNVSNVSNVLKDITAGIKLGATHVVHVGWSKSTGGNTTWNIVVKDAKSSQSYQVILDSSAHLVADAECTQTCTQSSVGSFETYVPFTSKVDVTAQALQTQNDAFAQGIAASARYLVQNELKAGKSWDAALKTVLANPDGEAAPGPAPVSHVVAIADPTTGDGTVVVNVFGQTYRFFLLHTSEKTRVGLTPAEPATALTAQQRQELSNLVRLQIATRATSNLVSHNFQDSLAEAVAGPTANGVAQPEPAAVIGHIVPTSGNSEVVTLPITGHNVRMTCTMSAVRKVTCTDPVAVD